MSIVTPPALEPDRVQQLRLAHQQDRERYDAFCEAERSAHSDVATLAEAARKAAEALEEARRMAATRTREREALARDIQFGQIMLAAADEALTPQQPQPAPVKTVAEPGRVQGDTVDCRHCRVEILRENGTWLHVTTAQAECGPDPSETRPEPVAPDDAGGRHPAAVVEGQQGGGRG
ncbi:hypothetical protein [Actinocorallia longicatena]|uniref:Uncharacterized protein n=1 Tax=Actinocorallia longicatena TaxID=111803 RepID=A0ABP6QDX0_9ACTN